MDTDELYIVNYCHRNCVPLKNIMRLPKEQAFALARELAEQNRNTASFYRFADFNNYYYRRLETDSLLYGRFTELGGKPEEPHPFSFVLQGSEFLDEWFDRGVVTQIPLNSIPEEQISFTFGDSMTVLREQGDLTLLTKKMLIEEVSSFGGTLEEFIARVNERYNYMEVQVWLTELPVTP